MTKKTTPKAELVSEISMDEVSINFFKLQKDTWEGHGRKRQSHEIFY